MTYVALRFVYGVYFLAACYFVLNAAAVALFSKRKWSYKAQYFVKALILSLLWPIAFLSPEGRKFLNKNTNQL